MIRVISRAATLDNLRDLLQEGVSVLHISCHGHEASPGRFILCFERSEDFGVCQLVSAEKLCEVIRQTKAKLSCLVIMACHSEVIGRQLFEELRVPLVISIQKDSAIENTACEIFSSEFYEKMQSMSYRDSLDSSRDAVNKYYKYCSCENSENHESPGRNKCNNMHGVDCACPYRLKNIHRSSDCAFRLTDSPNLKRIPCEKVPDSFMLCCCGTNHAEGYSLAHLETKSSSSWTRPSRRRGSAPSSGTASTTTPTTATPTCPQSTTSTPSS